MNIERRNIEFSKFILEPETVKAVDSFPKQVNLAVQRSFSMIKYYASLELDYPTQSNITLEQSADLVNELYAWNARLTLLRHSPIDLEQNTVKTWALEHLFEIKQR